MKNKKINIDAKFIFWIGMFIIGLGALIAGITLLVMTHNNLLWLIISLGLILFILGLLFSVYLFVIEHKRKQVREDITSKGI